MTAKELYDRAKGLCTLRTLMGQLWGIEGVTIDLKPGGYFRIDLMYSEGHHSIYTETLEHDRYEYEMRNYDLASYKKEGRALK